MIMLAATSCTESNGDTPAVNGHISNCTNSSGDVDLLGMKIRQRKTNRERAEKTTDLNAATSSADSVSTKQNDLFQEIIHDDDLCKEYIVRRRRSGLLLWITFFIVFHIGVIGYHFELYTQDTRILSGFIVVILCFCGWTLNRKVVGESLLVVSCLGVQITTKYASGRQTSIFFDISEIKDIIIQESITMQSVVFILSILLKKPTMDGHQLLPLFKHSFPRLWFLRQVYQGVQSVMSFDSQPVQLS